MCLLCSNAILARFDESEEAFLVTLSAQLATVVAHAEAIGSHYLSGVQRDIIE